MSFYYEELELISNDHPVQVSYREMGDANTFLLYAVEDKSWIAEVRLNGKYTRDKQLYLMVTMCDTVQKLINERRLQ